MTAQIHNPSLPHTLNIAMKSMLNEIHTAMPGTIEQYDYTTQKANIQPSLQRKYRDDSIVKLPVLVNVPIIWPRTSEGGISFPLKRGDSCLIIFSERSLDEWLTLGKLCTPSDIRRFDLSDGIAIPGLFAFNTNGPADNNEDFQIVYKGTTIRIKSNGNIEIGNSNLQAIVTENFLTHTHIVTVAVTVDPGTHIGTGTGTAAAAISTPLDKTLKVKAQ